MFFSVLTVLLLSVLAVARCSGALGRQCGGDRHKMLRARVEALAPCSADELRGELRSLPAAAAASSACCGARSGAAQPQRSGRPMRLEACVLGPVDDKALFAPLSQQACVHYRTSVSEQPLEKQQQQQQQQQSEQSQHQRQRGRGKHSRPAVAFCSEGIDFVVVPVDAPDLHIEVRGDDVQLFDMHRGRSTKLQRLATAPDHWQAFALLHRTRSAAAGAAARSSLGGGACGAAASSRLLQGDGPLLEFEECTLLPGSKVTLVGEVMRDARGRLSLLPWQQEVSQEPQREANVKGYVRREHWRTAWERSGFRAFHDKFPSSAPPARELQKRVLVSDDPRLIIESMTGRKKRQWCGKDSRAAAWNMLWRGRIPLMAVVDTALRSASGTGAPCRVKRREPAVA